MSAFATQMGKVAATLLPLVSLNEMSDQACLGYFPAPPHDRSGSRAEQNLMIGFGFARIVGCSASPAPGLPQRLPARQPGR
jgi:hypothetical protein